MRVDGGAGSLQEPRVFLSDRRAVQGSDVAAMLWEEAEVEAPDEDDEDESIRPIAEPVGDAGLMADFGTPEDVLLDLARRGGAAARGRAHGCVRARRLRGCLEQLREG